MSIEMGEIHVDPKFNGFLHASGGKLLDGQGREILLRGVGLGNWLLPEGYMWKFGPGAESPRQIEALTQTLIGRDDSERFWSEFRDAFISEDDIQMIAEQGFDHVRVPINSRIIMDEMGEPIESGFLLLDRIIEWCRKHRLWVLLDLHGAPGGQTGTNIDDSPHGRPELFMERRYWEQTVNIWRMISARYAKETVVMGYDLLNEPLPNEWQDLYSDALVTLYREITSVIREVDAEHLIVYEGTHWASNWEIFTEVFDSNSMLQFHKYWNVPDLASIQRFIDIGLRLNLPIYMGESGENNIDWLYTAFRLFESQGIGWNFWPWKKIETRTSPLSVVAPLGWDEIREYALGDRNRIPKSAKGAFESLLENVLARNCVRHPEIISAILGTTPERIPAWGYGFRGRGESYSTHAAVIEPIIRSGESVSIDFLEPSSEKAPNFEQNDGRSLAKDEQFVVHLEPSEWLEYEVAATDYLSDLVIDFAHGDISLVVLEPTPRGFKVRAKAPVDLVSFYRK